MSNQMMKLLATILATAGLFGCNLGVDRDGGATPEGYYYEGYIYNGVTNERITDLNISARQRGEDVEGTVEEDGHFMLGPIKPDHDYVVAIEADGFREFFAAESRLSSLPASIDNQSTFYYEAFLFPQDVVSPEVTLDFYTPDGISARPNGTLRLSPTPANALSAIHLDGSTTVGSVGGQVWSNDADRRERTVILDVEDGQTVVEEGALVYGVTYLGTIFGSDGYSYENFTYTSGLEGNRTVSLDRIDPQALALTANSLEISNVNADAEIVLTFSQPIELGGVLPAAELAETLDDSFSIDSPDKDNDGNFNVLESNVGDDPTAQERGVSFSIDGNTLTLSWERDNSNFATRDDDDPIESVTYGGLNNIDLRIADGRTDQEESLASLLGTNSLTVFVDGVSATNPLPPLALSSTNGTGDQNTGAVTIVYTFNRNISFDPDLYSQTQIAEFVDDGFSISSPNADVDVNTNTLPADVLATSQERGTNVSISDNELTLSWDRSLATSDPDDPILEVTFGNLGLVQIRPVGTTGASDTTLGAFVGASDSLALTP